MLDSFIEFLSISPNLLKAGQFMCSVFGLFAGGVALALLVVTMILSYKESKKLEEH